MRLYDKKNLTTPDVTSKPEDIPDGAETGGSASAVKLKGTSTNATVTPSALMVAGVTITGGTKSSISGASYWNLPGVSGIFIRPRSYPL